MTDDIRRDEAERRWEQLAAALAATSTDDEHDDLDPEVRTFDNGQHHYVVFYLKGRGVALEPDDARGFADDLLLAADDADERARLDSLDGTDHR